MMKRAKSIEARQEKAMEEKAGLLKNLETAEDLKLIPLSYRSELLASFEAVSPIFHGRPVCEPVSFAVNRGDRIVLDGRNGSGKSSLLKLLLEEVSERGRRYPVCHRKRKCRTWSIRAGFLWVPA